MDRERRGLKGVLSTRFPIPSNSIPTLLVSITHDGPFTVAAVITHSSSSSSASTEEDNAPISSSAPTYLKKTPVFFQDDDYHYC
ncbi:hypothetical protein PGTUg99_000921 [Puccinia graminis f. sp. tritici]|uniref:4'-phosphopantetheinyl transferase domain-containing protein n=1 Tax=Puccinia graminis f. sp. tritici TaxID=56615 RepID=A0A5B0LHH9_PUCGR|nr:hypothetical protein PGTUg99_005755 [Puccinia graminis f. sp. tritici]KAA1127607.1 hypothetical protein PGTUg99_000921 [Puccinia graminis f. sp. tritici]